MIFGESETKRQEGKFLTMSAHLAVSLFGSMLPGKKIIRAGKGVVRVGTG